MYGMLSKITSPTPRRFESSPEHGQGIHQSRAEVLGKYPQSSNAKRFGGDVYKWFCMDLFCDNMADFEMKFGKNMFDEGLDCKQFLMDYFKIQL